ncbi:PREDICTED: protein GPR108 [Myotis brandtii]|uniref:protein GPR108 n=1 Tax=Myotis brandtii TaxID=109478 RepID=UPI00070404DE|nr:PREDICTED: protein GPR108 [Myotis brandtii]
MEDVRETSPAKTTRGGRENQEPSSRQRIPLYSGPSNIWHQGRCPLQIVCCISFTRIIAILLWVAMPFQWQWLYQTEEGAISQETQEASRTWKEQGTDSPLHSANLSISDFCLQNYEIINRYYLLHQQSVIHRVYGHKLWSPAAWVQIPALTS